MMIWMLMKQISLEVEEILFHHSHHNHLFHLPYQPYHHHQPHYHGHHHNHHLYNHYLHQLHQGGIQHKLLVDGDTLMGSIHPMQDSQTKDTVQLGATIGHKSTFLNMVKNSGHVMIAEHTRDVAVLIRVSKMLLPKHHNNSPPPQPSHPPPPQPSHPPPLSPLTYLLHKTHSWILPSLQRIIGV